MKKFFLILMFFFFNACLLFAKADNPLKCEVINGVVKWFDSSKGFGLIEYEDGENIYVNFKDIVSEGFKTLEAGQKVEFCISEETKEKHAIKVKVLKDESTLICEDKSARIKGKVKWFNSAKGYGLITQEKGEDIYVNFKDIISEGFKTLAEGDLVSFCKIQSKNGVVAVKVKKE